MWARIVECMLGCWLLMSPFIFGYEFGPDGDAFEMLICDLTIGAALIVLSLASYWNPTRAAHWLLIPMAVGLLAFGRLATEPPLAPGHQNHIIVGLVLLMIAVVPNEASLPPRAWRFAADDPKSLGGRKGLEQ